MNTRIITALLILFASGITARAQVLNDFSTFVDPVRTFFTGTWSQGGGSTDPASAFSQGAGVYNIIGGKNDDASWVDYYYTDPTGNNIIPIGIGTNHMLSLSAMTLTGSSATSLIIRLSDNSPSTNFATASFDLTKLSSSQYTTLVSQLDTSLYPSFDWAAIQGFTISGGVTGGTETLSISFDNLSAVSAIPEPSTYAAIFGALTLGGVCYRRYRRK